jgi:CDP-glucose 4,6-dehydratase
VEDQRIGRVLRALRHRLGWRQLDLADRARVSQPTISLLERGHVGGLSIRALREICQAMEAEVVVLVRDTVPLTPVTAPWFDRVSIVRGAVEDQLLDERLLGEYQARTVFHLAAQTQVEVTNRNPVSTWTANILGTASLLEAARRSPAVEQVVTASSDKAYGVQPDLPYDETMPLLARNPYDVSKACADLVAASYWHTWGVPACVTRCGNFFGPGDLNWRRLVPGTIRSLLEDRRPVVRSDGTLVRDYLYVVDGALAYLQLAEAMACDRALCGEAFNFSNEEPTTVLDVVALLQRLTGRELEPDILATASHEIPAQHLSATKARKLLGWSPRWTLDQGLAETVRWYRDHLDGTLSVTD